MKKNLHEFPAQGWMIFLLLLSMSWFQATGAPLSPGSNRQGITVTGLIRSAIDEQPMIGVTVVEKGTQNGTITDADGKFSIMVSGKDAVLEFSFVGFNTEEVTVGDQTQINLTLIEKIETLSEVVVIGYGTSRKADLTGAVASVNAEEIQKLATPNIETALQGRAAGVFVTKGNGEPGAGASIYIRGPGTMGDTGPLWVIDGIPSEAGNTLDMSSIASIDILKDAASAAIYGARAANGVILVTTKRGSREKLKVGFNMYTAISQPMNLPDLVNAEEYAATKTQSQLNAGMADKKTGYIPAKFYQKYTDGDTMVYFPDGTPIIEGTPWFDILFKDGSIDNYNFYVTGGSENINFYTSFDYLNEKGTGIRSYFERFSLTMNSDFKLNKFVTVGESMQLTMTDRDGSGELTGEQMLRVNPFMPVMDESRNLPYPYENFGILDKDVYDFDPPSHYGMAHVENRSQKWYQLRGNAYIDIKPLKGLSWRTTFGGIMKFKNENYYGERYDMGRFYRYEDIKSQSVNDERNIAFNSFITYNRTIGKHTFTAMAGTEWKSFYGTTMEAKKDSFPIDLVTFDAGNNNKAGVSGHYLDPDKWVSYFGRLVYNYEDKYLLQANFRRDGSSKFGENNRYGNFPSFSAGWRITNEAFMESVKSFMDLKIRGGWGIIGNSSIGNFKYLATVNSNGVYYAFGSGPNQAPFYGAKPNSFPNQGVHWEEFNSTNIGFDLGLFNSSLMITADVYSRINKGMLIEVDLPFSSGYYEPWSSGSTTINVGECSNKGFEFTATYRKQISGLNFTVSGNMAYNKNNIEKLYADNAIIKGSMSQYVTEAGMPMSYYKGYEVERLFQATLEDSLEIFKRANVTDPTKYDPAKKLAPGDLKYVDQNGDGKITEEDKVMIGNPWPKYIYGLNITAEYKGFDLTIFAQGIAGKDIYNYQRRYAETFTGDYCPTKAILESWTVDNPDTDIPRMNYKDPNRNFSTSSSYFVESGSYFRLKNLQLGYTLPRKVQEYLHLSNLRLYVGAQNVFTITQYSGIDPEFSSGDNTNKDEDNGNYPQNRLYQFGFQIEF